MCLLRSTVCFIENISLSVTGNNWTRAALLGNWSWEVGSPRVSSSHSDPSDLSTVMTLLEMILTGSLSLVLVPSASPTSYSSSCFGTNSNKEDFTSGLWKLHFSLLSSNSGKEWLPGITNFRAVLLIYASFFALCSFLQPIPAVIFLVWTSRLVYVIGSASVNSVIPICAYIAL